ncbi:MAG TPA: universal stress protein [Hyphomicrobium sp.]|jgi:nucleotide-binding universal stress UspA family protein|uniref:universal stress protein n=1 Tax=Hyphomicrobium sp. TaxID=82 RepID=UPI002C957F63|nr:universal stress protein [Hyphomicrobium sp.]HXE02128.1 universal stress protein [Hyphomicrobium sp.]
MKLRRSFEEGHRRKLLIVVDESQEVESALYYAASRVLRSSGSVAMLYVIEPGEFQNWAGVRQVQLEEETTKAKALFRLFRRKLSLAGFENIETEEIIREGRLAEEILKLIADDEDIALLVLGASIDAKGPGPLVASFAAGRMAGGFPVPIAVVPGQLSLDEIKALA